MVFGNRKRLAWCAWCSEVLERCDQRERSVVAKLERLELKKIQEELQANVGGATSLGPGNLPIHIAGRIYSLVRCAGRRVDIGGWGRCREIVGGGGAVVARCSMVKYYCEPE